MKILKFEASNFKRLGVVEITPDGNIVQISGRNGSGKSSVLDAIFAALAGKPAIPGEPVHTGAEKATVRLDLGEVVVTRTFTAEGGTTLKVEGAKGARFPSPQKMLDDLVGSLSFDPLAFTRLKPAEQLEQLRGMVKIEVDIDLIDAQNKVDYASRTDVNRRAKDLSTRAAAIEVQPDLPEEPVSVDDLLAEMEGVTAFNSKLERRKKGRDELAQAIATERTAVTNMLAEVDELRARADALQKQAGELNDHADAEQKRLDEAEELPQPKDPAEITARIQGAQAVNKAIEQRAEQLRLQAEATEAEKESEALTTAMDERTKQRSDAIAAAAMPVPGLSFGDGQVLYKELPFSQASGAEQLRVSVAIAMAANPELRVLRIKDGSLLDEDSLWLLAEAARDSDYQIWVESVNTSGTMGIVMEDGAVVAVNPSISNQLEAEASE